ncbi:UDP-2,3-diacylglucosamine diphosphatase [bacterium]|nr:UDP-2,3-diacylglucosamine diphosphatase [bacterium]
MKPLFFVSDIHLGAGDKHENRKRSKKFIKFLNFVKEHGRGLVIVGDLFDFWFEYRWVMPRQHLDVLISMRELTMNGLNVSIVAGNHDFWIDDVFKEDLEISVHKDDYEIIDGDHRFYITHGDGIAHADKGYRFLKKILRNPLNIHLFRMIHPDLGFALANFSSRLSNRHQPFVVDDGDYQQFAEEKIAAGYHGIIMGHTHRAKYVKKSNGIYINLGDWNEESTYGKLQDGSLSLETWQVSGPDNN